MSRFDDQIADDSSKAVFTLGSKFLADIKTKSNNYQMLCGGRLVNMLVLFFAATS